MNDSKLETVFGATAVLTVRAAALWSPPRASSSTASAPTSFLELLGRLLATESSD
jgi:hypothetical protein